MTSKPRHSATGQASGKPSLARHPAFPLVIALWLAAALAIAGLAISPRLLEVAVAAVGLDRVIPAAAPPLGFTARLLVAAGLGTAGAIGGGALAWLSARRSAAGALLPATDRAAAAPVQPADDTEGEDFARLAAARASSPRRRRALTSETSELQPAEPAILEITSLPEIEPLAAPPSPEPAPAQTVPLATAPAPATSPLRAEPAAAHPAERPSRLVLPSGEAARHLREAALDSLGVDQLIARLALAIDGRRRAAAAPVHPPAAEPQPASLGAPLAAPPAAPLAVQPAAEPIAPRRFGRPAPLAGGAPMRPERPFDRPAMLRPLAEPCDGDDGDESGAPEDEALRRLLPSRRAPDANAPNAADYSSLLDMRPPARPVPLAGFVRVDEPAADHAPAVPQPVVIFPGQQPTAAPGPAAPPAQGPAQPARVPRLFGGARGGEAAQTEQALREALAALQKMSGTA